MTQPLEAAVKHLDSITSAWQLDIGILRAGFDDLKNRLESLESKVAAPQKPGTPI